MPPALPSCAWRTSSIGRWPRAVTCRSKLVPDRVEQQVAGLADPAADDHDVGVEDCGQRGHALPEPVAELGESRDRELVALLRGLGDQRPGDPVDVSPGPLDQLLGAESGSCSADSRATRTSARPEP